MIKSALNMLDKPIEAVMRTVMVATKWVIKGNIQETLIGALRKFYLGLHGFLTVNV